MSYTVRTNIEIVEVPTRSDVLRAVVDLHKGAAYISIAKDGVALDASEWDRSWFKPLRLDPV